MPENRSTKLNRFRECSVIALVVPDKNAAEVRDFVYRLREDHYTQLKSEGNYYPPDYMQPKRDEGQPTGDDDA